MTLATELKSYIQDNFLFGRPDLQLPDDLSFLESGIIDSTGILELLAFIEKNYGFRPEDDELVPENLDSIRNLCAYIERKTRYMAEEVAG
jgi:acyl carrier protein